MLAKKGLLLTFQDLRQSERETLFVHLMEGLTQIRQVDSQSHHFLQKWKNREMPKRSVILGNWLP